jgi:methylmalonyl-CoA mutase
MAIQLIINRELGQNKNENPLQGAFIIDELTELVEQAVLTEFRSLSERGGVLGAMERMYQRSKIQEESLLYETRKHSGELPVVGVNTFRDPEGSPTVIPDEVIRSTAEERDYAVDSVHAFEARNETDAPQQLQALQRSAVEGGNVYDTLLEASKVASLGQLSAALYSVGGQYRRNM